MSVYEGSLDEAWDDYFVYGGLPLILTREQPEDKAEYLINLFKNVYTSDIIERHKIRNAIEFDELVDVLASAIGSLTNPTKLSKTIKSTKNKPVSDITLKKYIEYLMDSFLVNKAIRYNIKGRKYINSPAKYYFEDVGLRNARLNFRQIEENHIMENLIYNELRIRGFNVDVGVVDVYSKDKNNKTIKKSYEVDFIASKGNQKYYIQSAFAMNSAEKEQQEQNSLVNISDSFKKIIIVKDNIKPRRNEQGIMTIGIKNFLLNEDSLEM